MFPTGATIVCDISKHNDAGSPNKRMAQKMHLGRYMALIYILDVDPERAQRICSLLQQYELETIQCETIDEINEALDRTHQTVFIMVHCALVNYSFTELALLRHRGDAELIFYCTDADHKSSSSVIQLPEELDQIISRIKQGKPLQIKAS